MRLLGGLDTPALSLGQLSTLLWATAQLAGPSTTPPPQLDGGGGGRGAVLQAWLRSAAATLEVILESAVQMKTEDAVRCFVALHALGYRDFSLAACGMAHALRLLSSHSSESYLDSEVGGSPQLTTVGTAPARMHLPSTAAGLPGSTGFTATTWIWR